MGENSGSKVDINAVTDVKEKLIFAVNKFNANIPLCSYYSIFSVLADAGFDTSCCNAYDTAVKELASKLSSLSTALDTYINNVEQADKEIEKEIPDDDTTTPEDTSDKDKDEKKEEPPQNEDKGDELGDVPDGIGDGENKDGKSGNPDEDQKDDKDDKNKKPPLKKPKNNNPDMNKIYEEFSKYYGNMSKSSLVSIMSNLYDEASKRGITIEELLSSDKYNSVVLSFMNNNSLSSEMRERMKELGVDISRRIMHDYLVGEKSVIGYSETAKTNIYKSLEAYCKTANKTADSILNSKDGSLREVLNTIGNSIKEQNGNTRLLETILGFDDNKLAEILSKWKK